MHLLLRVFSPISVICLLLTINIHILVYYLFYTDVSEQHVYA